MSAARIARGFSVRFRAGTRFFLTCVLLLPAVGFASQTEDEETLRHFKTVLWPQAYRSQDVELLGELLHDSFQMLDDKGNHSDRAEEMEWISNNTWNPGNFEYRIERLDIYNDDTAIISGQGVADSYSYRSSNVLIKTDGRWQAISSHVSGFSETPGELTQDEASIRSQRKAFNLAIVDQDVDAIAGFLAPEYHIVTGRSAQAHGIAQERELWSDTFAKDPGFVCERELLEISLNTAWGLAQEQGKWECRYGGEESTNKATGVYGAKWQQALDGRWLLQVEVFTTLACEGDIGGCSPPDVID